MPSGWYPRPHAAQHGRGGGGDGAGGKTGVVGVSCVLTNWTGGWDAERIGLPVQGVLLDHVGCKYHWDEDGFPTDINLHKLMEVLESGDRKWEW